MEGKFYATAIYEKTAALKTTAGVKAGPSKVAASDTNGKLAVKALKAGIYQFTEALSDANKGSSDPFYIGNTKAQDVMLFRATADGNAMKLLIDGGVAYSSENKNGSSDWAAGTELFWLVQITKSEGSDFFNSGDNGTLLRGPLAAGTHYYQIVSTDSSSNVTILVQGTFVVK